MNATRPLSSAGSSLNAGIPDCGNPFVITALSASSVAARGSGPRLRSTVADRVAVRAVTGGAHRAVHLLAERDVRGRVLARNDPAPERGGACGADDGGRRDAGDAKEASPRFVAPWSCSASLYHGKRGRVSFSGKTPDVFSSYNAPLYAHRCVLAALFCDVGPPRCPVIGAASRPHKAHRPSTWRRRPSPRSRWLPPSSNPSIASIGIGLAIQSGRLEATNEARRALGQSQEASSVLGKPIGRREQPRPEGRGRHAGAVQSVVLESQRRDQNVGEARPGARRK